MKSYAVFEGGGVKGIAFLGALEVMESQGFEWERVAGTSAGAIIASLIAAGYRSKEIIRLIDSFEFIKLIQKEKWQHIPYIGKWIQLMIREGMYSGNYLEQWIYEKLGKKGVYTFADLGPDQLKIVASDISSGKMVVLPDDIKDYGLSPEKFPIAKAVRMSASIPFYFEPVKIGNYYFVDGGLLSNYPIWLFDNKGEMKRPTFGFRLAGKTMPEHPQKIDGPFSLIMAIFKTMREAHDKMFIEEQHAVRTIFIHTGNISSTDFHITKEQRQFLLESGRVAARKFLQKKFRVS